MKDLQRDLFKLAGMGFAIVVVIKLLENAGGAATLVSAIGGTYNASLGTLLSGRYERV